MLAAAGAALAAAAATASLGAPRALAALEVGGQLRGFRSTHEFTAVRLSERPAAFLLRDYLTADECDALMQEAEASGEMHAAETSGRTDARKRCEICCLGPKSSPTVASLTKEAARLLLDEEAVRLPGAGCEDMHVLRYAEGGEFLLHYDAVSLPRCLTVLYYLNGVGSTWFPLADDERAEELAAIGPAEMFEHASSLEPTRDGLLAAPAAPGDAVAFFNFCEDGTPDATALHAGMPVGEGETKWLAAHFFQAPTLIQQRVRGDEFTAAAETARQVQQRVAQEQGQASA